MARKSAHSIVREWRLPQGSRFAVDVAGRLMNRAASPGSTWKLGGHLKTDLTLAGLDEIAKAKGWRETARSYSVPPSFVPNPATRHAKRKVDAAKRAEKAKELDDDQRKIESGVLAAGLEGLPVTIGYVASCCRARRSPFASELRYLYDMARFNGGATGGYLGTAIQARYHLKDPTADQLENLDALADVVARAAFGTATAAAERWHRAFYGA